VSISFHPVLLRADPNRYRAAGAWLWLISISL